MTLLFGSINLAETGLAEAFLELDLIARHRLGGERAFLRKGGSREGAHFSSPGRGAFKWEHGRLRSDGYTGRLADRERSTA